MVNNALMREKKYHELKLTNLQYFWTLNVRGFQYMKAKHKNYEKCLELYFK